MGVYIEKSHTPNTLYTYIFFDTNFFWARGSESPLGTPIWLIFYARSNGDGFKNLRDREIHEKRLGRRKFASGLGSGFPGSLNNGSKWQYTTKSGPRCSWAAPAVRDWLSGGYRIDWDYFFSIGRSPAVFWRPDGAIFDGAPGSGYEPKWAKNR